MCELCSEDEKVRKAHTANLLSTAERLRKMARHLEDLASGDVKPHTKEASIHGVTARALVRGLVADYV